MQTILYYILNCVVNDTHLATSRLKGLLSEDWKALFEILRGQGVSAVVFDKIKVLPKEVALPKEVLLKWYSQASYVERQLTKMFDVAAEFAAKMHENGISVVVLKGVAFGTYYPNPMSRECGDLDCFMLGKGREGDTIAVKIGGHVEDGGYKHSHMHYKGLTIENHYYLTNFNNTSIGIYTERCLQRLVSHRCRRIGDTYLLNPSADFNAFFLIKHAQMHFIGEGINIRHLLDWSFFLRKEQDNVDWEQLIPEMERCGVLRFARMLTEICVVKFGVVVRVGGLRLSDNDKKGHALVELVFDDIMKGYPDMKKENIFQKGCRIMRRFYRMWVFRSIASEDYLTLVWNTFAFSSYLKRKVRLKD